MRPKYRIGGVLLAVLAIVLIAGGSVAVAQAPAVGEIPFLQAWAGSGHADVNGEPFNHWNAEGEVPTSCAKCHSTPAISTSWASMEPPLASVDNPAPIGTVIQCIACHNDAAQTDDGSYIPVWRDPDWT